MTKTLLALSSVALATALVGCGSGSGEHSPASSTAALQDRGVKFAQCMRKHGIQMEDPKPGQGGFSMRVDKGSEAKMKAAQEACKAYSPIVEGKGKMSAEDFDRQLKLARCLRRNGVAVKDPKPGEPFGISTTRENAAKTDKAMKICQKEVGLPGPRNGNGSAPGSGGSGAASSIGG